ncbi:hypothetical protein [Streptoalloteichus hindustanus]|uniref:Uncharacterized protein n=1 Tax=Streptoalloteichus hindustanus TaxID=2017 RepID=A0A1M5BH53_STRHI|nr:hypothetical protein [Streptoalloteichus hindustanus]SHF41914.1 hypothetical protein SAMN05444320_103575 [Streptoalloteichus hindustanus]
MDRRRPTRAPLLPGDGPLSRVPPVVAFLVVFGLFALGVWLRGAVGAALLGLLTLLVVVLLVATWSRLRPVERVGRIVVIAVLAAVAVSVLF